MLTIASRKLETSKLSKMISFCQGDALDLPFPDNRFICATSGFALRNVDDIVRCLSEMYRVVSPGGRVVTLELTPLNPSSLLTPLLTTYFSRWVPLLGQLVSGDREAYTYLPNSVCTFPTAEELAGMFKEVGMDDVNYRLFNCESVAIHWGTKP